MLFASWVKVMIVELLESGRKVKEISDEYSINGGMIRRWRREYEAKAGDFSKKREISQQKQELKMLKKGNYLAASNV